MKRVEDDVPDLTPVIEFMEPSIRAYMGLKPSVRMVQRSALQWKVTGRGKWLGACMSEFNMPDKIDRLVPMVMSGPYSKSVEVTLDGTMRVDGKRVELVFPAFGKGVYLCGYLSNKDNVLNLHIWARNVSQKTVDKDTREMLRVAIGELVALTGEKHYAVISARKILEHEDTSAVALAIQDVRCARDEYQQDLYRERVESLAPVFRMKMKVPEDTPVLLASRRCRIQGPGKWMSVRTLKDFRVRMCDAGEFREAVEPMSYGLFIDRAPLYLSSFRKVLAEAGDARRVDWSALSDGDFLATMVDGESHMLVMVLDIKQRPENDVSNFQ